MGELRKTERRRFPAEAMRVRLMYELAIASVSPSLDVGSGASSSKCGAMPSGAASQARMCMVCADDVRPDVVHDFADFVCPCCLCSFRRTCMLELFDIVQSARASSLWTSSLQDLGDRQIPLRTWFERSSLCRTCANSLHLNIVD